MSPLNHKKGRNLFNATYTKGKRVGYPTMLRRLRTFLLLHLNSLAISKYVAFENRSNESFSIVFANRFSRHKCSKVYIWYETFTFTMIQHFGIPKLFCFYVDISKRRRVSKYSESRLMLSAAWCHHIKSPVYLRETNLIPICIDGLTLGIDILKHSLAVWIRVERFLQNLTFFFQKDFLCVKQCMC